MSRREQGRPPRRTEEQLVRYYWHPSGGGYRRALSEARTLLEAGAPLEEVAEGIGWTVRQLLRALPPEFSSRRSPTSAA